MERSGMLGMPAKRRFPPRRGVMKIAQGETLGKTVTHPFSETNPRGEAAFKSCLTKTSGCPILAASLFLRLGWDNTNLNQTCHPERSIAESKELRLLFVALKGHGFIRAAIDTKTEGGGGFNPRKSLHNQRGLQPRRGSEKIAQGETRKMAKS